MARKNRSTIKTPRNRRAQASKTQRLQATHQLHVLVSTGTGGNF